MESTEGLLPLPANANTGVFTVAAVADGDDADDVDVVVAAAIVAAAFVAARISQPLMMPSLPAEARVLQHSAREYTGPSTDPLRHKCWDTRETDREREREREREYCPRERDM
jgi:hypothetical protein